MAVVGGAVAGVTVDVGAATVVGGTVGAADVPVAAGARVDDEAAAVVNDDDDEEGDGELVAAPVTAGVTPLVVAEDSDDSAPHAPPTSTTHAQTSIPPVMRTQPGTGTSMSAPIREDGSGIGPPAPYPQAPPMDRTVPGPIPSGPRPPFSTSRAYR